MASFPSVQSVVLTINCYPYLRIITASVFKFLLKNVGATALY